MTHKSTHPWRGRTAAASLALAATVLTACGDDESTATTPVDPTPVAVNPITDCAPGAACAASLPVKVVIVAMFEIGEDTGDAPGEFQLWKERLDLDTKIPFPHAHHDLYYNPDTQVLGMVTGIGTAKSAPAIMAVGLDQRLDLTKAYWLVAGIAGIDPEDASIGSAAWASFLVDADLAHEIDAREKPEDWETGYFARYTKFPYDPERPDPTGEMFIANPALRDWAYELTKDLTLPDHPSIAEERSHFTNHPNAQKPPFVLKGAQLAGMTFWHGEIMNDWANKWVDYWTDGEGNYVTSAMEDTGSYQSMVYLHETGRVDKNRFMVLRAGSNFTMPPPGVTAAEYLLRENEGYVGMEASLESLYLVGNTVIEELLGNWDTYGETVPGE